MWADTLLDIERGHLLRLGLWAAVSVLMGGLLLLVLRRQASAAFVRHFAIQSLVWGAVLAVATALNWRALALRDYASATQFRNFLWLDVGLDAGYAGIGVTLTAAAWILGRKFGGMGAGIGIVVQAFVLFVLDLRLLTLVESARIALAPLRDSGWLAA